MSIPLIFPPDALAVDVQNWANLHGLRLRCDLRGNLVAVAGEVHHG